MRTSTTHPANPQADELGTADGSAPSCQAMADGPSALRVLVVGRQSGAARFLSERLAGPRFEVAYTVPGSDFVAAATSAPVAFAVIDEIDQRPHAAQVEIAVLKQLHPKVQIVVISTHSSEGDAGIVELGVLYYLAGQSFDKLVRVIRSAAEMVAPHATAAPHPERRPSRPAPLPCNRPSSR